MSEHDKYIEDRQLIERVRVVGPMSESKTVIESLGSEQFRVVVSGPYSNREMHPAVDLTKFLFIAERQIDDP